jgi:hypothetical protein
MEPAIARGSILAYRVFDAGDVIVLDRAEKLLGNAKRVSISGPLAPGLVIPARPLEVAMGECDIAIPGLTGKFRAKSSARIFDFGAISVLHEIAIDPGTTLRDLTPICDALYDAVELVTLGCEHRKELIAKLRPAIEKAHDWAEAETYTIVFVEELSGVEIADLSTSESLAKLLLGERSSKPLSEAARDDVLKHSFSYLADDLVIIDWNSAFVVEPSGSRVVADVLELATCQLLEFRYYDMLLDRELATVYDHVEKQRALRIFRDPFRRLTRQVLRRFMELTEFTERVDNAIKSVGDFYLARVYLAAIRRFRVPEWRESVESKLSLISRAYDLLKGEIETSRAQLLELTVVILIFVEILAAFQRGH